jgi:hypothetical protein
MLLHQKSQRQRQHQRPRPRSSCLLFVLLLLSSWLCTSAQAVLTEDAIINKELAWVAAMTRKAYKLGFYAISHDSNSSNNDDDNNDIRTQLQWQDDRNQLQKQEEEQRMRQQHQEQEEEEEQQQRDEKAPTAIHISRPNLRGPSAAQLRRLRSIPRIHAYQSNPDAMLTSVGSFG